MSHWPLFLIEVLCVAMEMKYGIQCQILRLLKKSLQGDSWEYYTVTVPVEKVKEVTSAHYWWIFILPFKSTIKTVSDNKDMYRFV